jgi:hypothetical protein
MIDIGCSESIEVLEMHPAASDAPEVLVGNKSTQDVDVAFIID